VIAGLQEAHGRKPKYLISPIIMGRRNLDPGNVGKYVRKLFG
jgi:hypothetical protein